MFEPLPDEEQIDNEPPRRSAITGTHAAIVAVALAVFGVGSYAIHEHKVAQTAIDQNAAIAASLKNTNAQVEQLTAKLNEVSTPKPEAVDISPTVSKPKAIRSHHQTAVRRVRHDDPRWKKLQSQLDEQGKAIASTQQDLSSTRTELQGSIARTHGELVVLQKKGERRYYEFDIQKSKQFAPTGTMNVKLRKANVKHQYADLDLLVDDRVVTKKHVNLYEPTTFYVSDNEQPIQVVINSISKNHIHGYVSEPKYQKSELAAMQQESDQSGQQGANTSATLPKERQRLVVSK